MPQWYFIWLLIEIIETYIFSSNVVMPEINSLWDLQCHFCTLNGRRLKFYTLIVKYMQLAKMIILIAKLKIFGKQEIQLYVKQLPIDCSVCTLAWNPSRRQPVRHLNLTLLDVIQSVASTWDPCRRPVSQCMWC